MKFRLSRVATALIPAFILALSGCGEHLVRTVEIAKLYAPELGVNPANVYYDFEPSTAIDGDWSGIEGDASDHKVWVIGPNARYHFRISPVPDIYSICVGYGAFYQDSIASRNIDVSLELNGQALVTWRGNGGRRPGSNNWCTTLDSGAFSSGDNVLAIHPNSFISPKEIGMSEDDRKLSIMVDYISVFPAKFGTMTVPSVSKVNAGTVLQQSKMNADALRLASGGSVALPLAVPPSATLELGLPSQFLDKGGILSISFKPASGPVTWRQSITTALPPVRSLYTVNFYRVDLGPLERTAGSMIFSYEPTRANSPDYALIVDPVILTPSHPASTAAK